MTITTSPSCVAPERIDGAPTRCECPDCGIHTMATVGTHTPGRCPNCGASGLIPINTEPLYRPTLLAPAPQHQAAA